MKNKMGSIILAMVGYGYFIAEMSVVAILVLIVIGLAKLIFRF